METYSDSEPLTENQEGSKNCFMQYCRDIRKDLKVLNLLKEKRVDLDWLSFCSSNSIKNTLEIYNKFLLLSTELSANYIHNKNE